MNEKPNINAWVLKEKELLEKLSLEISSNFSISEKLAKKLIYETHLSLNDLKSEISLENSNNNQDFIDKNFDDEKLNKLLSVLDWVRKIIKDSSQSEIEELKKILENTDKIVWNDSELMKKLFSQKLIEKAKKPKNISDQILWATLWIANSTIIITELLYDLWIWIIKSIPDLIAIIKWNWEVESIKKL